MLLPEEGHVARPESAGRALDDGAAGFESIDRYFSTSDASIGLEITIEKNIPPGSGLGSSAASSVGGAVAAARALGLSLDRNVLLEIARDAEALSAGSPHLDNRPRRLRPVQALQTE